MDEIKEEFDRFMMKAGVFFAVCKMLQNDYPYLSISAEKPTDWVLDPGDPEGGKVVPQEEFHVTISCSRKPFDKDRPVSPRVDPLGWVRYHCFSNPKVHQWFEEVVEQRVRERDQASMPTKLLLVDYDLRRKAEVIQAIVKELGYTQRGAGNVCRRLPVFLDFPKGGSAAMYPLNRTYIMPKSQAERLACVLRKSGAEIEILDLAGKILDAQGSESREKNG